jgi:hypothetical protein
MGLHDWPKPFIFLPMNVFVRIPLEFLLAGLLFSGLLRFAR